ncbi:MAG TPA: SCO family protein [Gammaproteobacteria bacterium]|nr:SCO family protein [Gammaproteobacteria bacterium]
MSNTKTSAKNKKIIFTLLAIIALVAAIEIYFGMLQRHETASNVKIDGIFLTSPKEINQFNLSASNGKPFTKNNLTGQWTMLFFGFTNCSMVCPTTMAALNDMYKLLEKDLPADKMPQIVMVSVDPDRDSVKRMKEYVTAFNPNFIGARADITETVALEKQLHIAAAKMQVDGAGKNHYTINHSAEILLFNPKGQLQAYLSFPHQAPQMAKDYQQIIKAAV